MNFQDDPFFNPVMEAGCYYISLANLAELVMRKPVDRNLIRTTALKEVLDGPAGDMDSEMVVQNASDLLARFGCSLKQRLNNGAAAFDASYQCGSGEYEILQFSYTASDGSVYKHFVLGDGKGCCLQDPIKAGSNSVKKGKVISKRIFA